MSRRLLIPVWSYMDNLMPMLLSQAGNKMPNIEFRQLKNPDYNRGAFCHVTTLAEEERTILENAEVILADAWVVAHNMECMKKAKWVQSTFAGVDDIVSQCDSPPHFLLTRQGGTSFGQQMGEYVLMQILARERNLFAMQSEIEQRKWLWKSSAPRTLPSLSVGILGVGNIGKRIAEMCKSMKMQVWGLVRTGSQDLGFLDHNCQLPQLPQLLESCDYVCNILPSTRQTKDLLDGDMLKHCSERKSVFINIGRGDVISEESIIRALKEGWLGGAVLDVFQTEPLPRDSALWSTPGVTITPHMSGLCSADDTASLFLDNLQRYLSGQPLQHVVDFSRGY